jgi:hypothetical protein
MKLLGGRWWLRVYSRKETFRLSPVSLGVEQAFRPAVRSATWTASAAEVRI